MGNPVVHFEIVGKDAPRVRSFFADVFGWKIGEFIAGPGLRDYTLVDTGGAGINGGIGSPPDGYDGHVTFYVHVESVADTLEAIEQRGGTHMMGPEPAPGGIVVGLFRDPAGNVIGLVQGGPS
jgi:predicted enzyme related to lactoylglutathione lyase